MIPNTTGKLILYVEDNAENRMLVRRVLMAEGYQVMEAADALAALALVQERVPDLVLVDINMPEIDGYTLTARFKALPQMKGVPIIAMTANVMKGDRERSLEAGCDGYIQKPIDVDLLGTQVEEFLNAVGGAQ